MQSKPEKPRGPGRGAMLLVASMLSVFAASQAMAGAPALAKLAEGLNIDEKAISVSGISSGAFFAHQFHVVHSQHVMGAGIVAGGSYYCAEGKINDALTECSNFSFDELTCQAFVGFAKEELGNDAIQCGGNIPKLAAEADAVAEASWKEAEKQSATQYIANDNVYLFSGTRDEKVPSGVMDAVHGFYHTHAKLKMKKNAVPGETTGLIRYNNTFPVHHAMITDGFNAPAAEVIPECAPPKDVPSTSENPFIYNCGEAAKDEKKEGCDTDGRPACADLKDADLAGAILRHIYGEKALGNARLPVEEEEVQAFDQKDVFEAFSSEPYNARISASMAREGYVFVPESCKKGERCKLHVAFHGCLQGGRTDQRYRKSGNLYAKFAGYNEWAKTNNIVVLYPQVERRHIPPPMNPQGCWDWWGQNYTHGDYHTKDAPQIKAVAQMINILLGSPKNGPLEAPAAKD